MLVADTYTNMKNHNTKWKIFLHKNAKGTKLESTKLRHKILDDFMRVSTVPAMDRIFHRTSKVIERVLWSLGFITAFSIFSYVTWNIAHIYRYHPLKTVISDLQLPVFKIPFPEVTVCNKNRLNWQRYPEAKDRFLLPQHQTVQHEQVFMETLNAYDTLQFGKFDNFKNISYLYPPILLRDLNYINFTLVVELMAWRCYEILTECFWINQSYNCCDIFSARKSQQGQCLSFNTIETTEGMLKHKLDHYYPWHTFGMGPQFGLKVHIHLREEFHSPLAQDTKGVMLMLVEPEVWSYLPHEIPPNTRAMVSISAYLQFHDEFTRIFPSDVRKCVFEDELESLFYKSLNNHNYMFENCQSECQQEYLMKFCNCTVDLFYPPDTYRACRLTDLPCLYEHNEFLQNFEQVGEHDYIAYHESGMNCPCYFNCKSLAYFPDVHADNLPNSQMELNETEVLMEVYFIWDTIKVYKTTAVYTFIDLMASLGGLAGLCIGCSLVGITELLFFFLVDIPKRAVLCCRASTCLKSKTRWVKTKPVLVKKITLIP